MRLITAILAAQLALLAPARAAAPLVFFDIAGPDRAALQAFYTEVLAFEVAADGAVTVPATGPLPGLVGQDPPRTMLYFGVDDVTATLAKVVAHGGSIEAPRFEVRGVVVLGLFKDPAGNRVGLVEMRNGKATVP